MLNNNLSYPKYIYFLFYGMNNNNNAFHQLQDVQMLNNIIDQVCDRPMSKSTHLSGFQDDDDDEDEGPKFKEVASEYLAETAKVLCIWDCCTLWLKVSEVLAFLVFDPFTELTITLCIVVNVLFMAMDHYSIEYDLNGGM